MLGKGPGSAVNLPGGHFPFRRVSFLVCETPFVQDLHVFVCVFFPTSSCFGGKWPFFDLTLVSFPKAQSEVFAHSGSPIEVWREPWMFSASR